MAKACEVFLGAVFARYTVLEDRQPGQRYVLCRCECGTEKRVQYDKLGKRDALSCGCLRLEKHTTHGMKGTPTYRSWGSMVQRCTNPAAHEYPEYGGRGITMCDEWRDFLNFFRDMGERPSGTSLDRIDNGLGYFPGNCRWATPREQALNKRSTVNITAFGETKSIAEWLEDDRCVIGSRSTITARLKFGWPGERIITEVAVMGRNQWSG